MRRSRRPAGTLRVKAASFSCSDTALPGQTLASLRDAGALQPVYRRDPAVIVALPEVRVEFDTPEQRRAVMDDLAEDRALPHSISQSTDDGMTCDPRPETALMP